MSIDISTDICKPFLVSDFKNGLLYAIKDITGIESIPEIEIHLVLDGKRYNIVSDRIGDITSVYSICLVGIEEKVDLIIVNHNLEDMGIFASVDLNTPITPVEFMLAASIIIAIARISESIITDERLYWTDTYEQTIENFIQKIKLTDRSNNIIQAANSLFAKQRANKKD